MQVSSLDSKTLQTQVATTIQKQLDKNAFLQLLVTQLKNQNPLQPSGTDDFINQMVQFTILEQLANMNAVMEQIANYIELSQGASLIGHQVKLNENGEEITGAVEKVSIKEGDVYLLVGNRSYKLSQVTEVLG